MKKIIPHCGFETRDPYVIKYRDTYYRCYTKNAAEIYISRADSIDALADAEEKCVFTPEPDREYSKELWAPELHIIDDKCYIYVACDDGNNHNHRMYVLENNSNDPMKPYAMHGKISDESNKWAIDGNVFEYNGVRYFIWAGWEGDRNICQNLYIAKMKNPYELEGKRIMISTPEYAWEKLGSSGEDESPFINEGAYAFEHDGKLYVTYSAAGSWCENYCIALLKLEGDNPLDASSWTKLDTPVFSSNDKVKGAGHASVVTEDGKHLIFFHAWDKEEKSITWGNVSVWCAELKVKNNEWVIE